MKAIKSLNLVIVDFDDIRNPLLNAGQAKSTFEIAKRLVRSGHKVSVLSSKYPGYQDRREEGIIYKHIGISSKNIKLNNIAYILSVPFYIRKIKADIIIECFTAPVSTLLTPLYTSVPVVAKPTSFEADRFSRLYHIPFNMVEKFGCRFYKYFIPANTSDLKKMQKINPSVKFRIIPEGVDDIYFKIKRSKQKHVLFLGRLDIGQKGIDLLLKAYKKIEKRIRYPLIIAGHGPDETRIKELIHNLKLGNKVKLIGAAYGESKLKVLSEAVFVALPSRHEGFSIFALEALASGLPLVTFDIEELSWQTEEVSLKSPAFDCDLYSELLTKASDKNVNAKMSTAARNFARKFTWEKTASEYENFLLNVYDSEKKLLKVVNSSLITEKYSINKINADNKRNYKPV